MNAHPNEDSTTAVQISALDDYHTSRHISIHCSCYPIEWHCRGLFNWLTERMGSNGEFPPIKRRGNAACRVIFKAARGFGKSRVRFVPSAFLSCLEWRTPAPTSYLSDSPLKVLVPLNIKRDTALSDNGADRKISQTKCDSQPQCVPRRRHPFCIILFFISWLHHCWILKIWLMYFLFVLVAGSSPPVKHGAGLL